MKREGMPISTAKNSKVQSASTSSRMFVLAPQPSFKNKECNLLIAKTMPGPPTDLCEPPSKKPWG